MSYLLLPLLFAIEIPSVPQCRLNAIAVSAEQPDVLHAHGVGIRGMMRLLWGVLLRAPRCNHDEKLRADHACKNQCGQDVIHGVINICREWNTGP
jgi:hypothetical protein